MRACILAACIFVLGCRDSVDGLIGPTEPITVLDASFAGELALRDDGPTVTAVDSASGIVLAGQRDRNLAGRVDASAWAVAMRIEELGSGWWVAPIEDLDPAFVDQRGFELRYDLGAGVPTGLRRLQLAAVDEHGDRGPSFDLDVCVIDERIPDDLNICDPKLPPPDTVISLTWDRPADLDLRVRTPSGRTISWKRPLGAGPDDEVDPDDPTTGRFTRDSNAGCDSDGRNAEAVVWEESPDDGPFSVFVDLFEACGERQVPFTVTVYRRFERDDGSFGVRQSAERKGMLLDLAADGGSGHPLFVLSTRLD